MLRVYYHWELDEETLNLVRNVISSTYAIKFETIKIEKDLIKNAFNFWRKQFNASLILRIFSRLYKPFLVLLVDDIYIPRLNYVFGVAVPGEGVVLSTYRFKINASPEIFNQRLTKTIKHELGHFFGLPHCDNYCVMRFANSLLELDLKNINFCDRCRNELIRRGALKDKKD